MKTIEQIRAILEQDGKYIFTDSEEAKMYEKYTKEIDFINRAKAVGLPTIIHNGIEKVYLNLQEPVKLKDDFELPVEFNHLVYFTDIGEI